PGCGGRTRTCDLLVMSQTSFLCSTPLCVRLWGWVGRWWLDKAHCSLLARPQAMSLAVSIAKIGLFEEAPSVTARHETSRNDTGRHGTSACNGFSLLDGHEAPVAPRIELRRDCEHLARS